MFAFQNLDSGPSKSSIQASNGLARESGCLGRSLCGFIAKPQNFCHGKQQQKTTHAM